MRGARKVDRDVYSDGPVWGAFGLTRASYAVFPRRALCSMPREWQERFVALVDEMHQALPAVALSGDYVVNLRERGRFVRDWRADYRHASPFPLRSPKGRRGRP